MENEMKISPSVVRRLRVARGWSQEQLATASGLSLRTIQRVEAEGVASMGTRVSLAATFALAQADLVEAPEPLAPAVPARDAGMGLARAIAGLIAGLAILCCVVLLESARLSAAYSAPGQLAFGTMQAVCEAMLAAIGVLVLIPSTLLALRQRRIAGVALATLGTPLVVLLAAGLLFAALRGHAPNWGLFAFGAGGLALLGLLLRDARRPAHG